MVTTSKPAAAKTEAAKPDAVKSDAVKSETADDPTPVKASASVDTAEAHTDRVAMVSRTKDGAPDQSADYELIVPDREKARAENRPADNQVAES